MTTIRVALRRFTRVLEQAGIPNAQREAAWLCEAMIGLSQAVQHTHGSEQMTPGGEAYLAAAVARRANGEPYQYIVACEGFCDLRISVGPGVLIPRPETEGLVEIAARLYSRGTPVCDLCTGSGCVALALAHVLRPATPWVIGVDISAAALHYAARNRRSLEYPTVRFVQGDLLTSFRRDMRFGLITANPPYIPAAHYAALPRDVRDFEPAIALLAEDNGLHLVKRVIREAFPHLLPGGSLVCELDSDQAPAAIAVLEATGYTDCTVHDDCYAKPRFVSGRRSV